MAEFDELIATAVSSVDRMGPTRACLELMPNADVAARAADLAVRETGCSSFFTFTLTATGGAPCANAYAEQWVRTVRTECLDWQLIWSDRHLHRVLTAYLAHYNRARPHRGLGLGIPVPVAANGGGRADVPAGRIERVGVLGGLLHEYRRAA